MPPQKMFIQMSGAPGSGKSTIASLISQSVDAVVINHDLIKSFFLAHNIPFAQASILAYSFDWELAEDLIKQGRSVIVDSTCYYQETLNKGAALARKYDYEYKYVECRVSDMELLDQRLRSRTPLRSQRTSLNSHPADYESHAEDSQALAQRWTREPCRPSGDILMVDSSADPEVCMAQINEYLFRSTGNNDLEIRK